jgi:hypothetical protein
MAAEIYKVIIPKNSFHGDVSHKGFSQWDLFTEVWSCKSAKFNKLVAGFLSSPSFPFSSNLSVVLAPSPLPSFPHSQVPSPTPTDSHATQAKAKTALAGL